MKTTEYLPTPTKRFELFKYKWRCLSAKYLRKIKIQPR
jgi:hypothetical protein